MLAVDDETKTSIGDNDGINHLHKMAKGFPGSASVQADVAGALAVLAVDVSIRRPASRSVPDREGEKEGGTTTPPPPPPSQRCDPPRPVPTRSTRSMAESKVAAEWARERLPLPMPPGYIQSGLGLGRCWSC